MNYIDRIKKMHACGDAVGWLTERNYPTLQEAWNACERGDWMLWYAGRQSGQPDSPSRRRLVACACACARVSLHLFGAKYPDDNRPRRAIEAAEAWARGDADAPSSLDVRSAAYAASAAANVAYAASAAANAANAAYAAAHAASAAYTAASAANAAEPRQAADIVREHYPSPPRKASR